MKELLTLVIGFFPWILFLLLSGHTLSSLENSILISLIACLILGFKELRKGFLLQWGTLIFFSICFIIINVMHLTFLAEYMGIFANGFLSLIIWISIVIGKPFTLQYVNKKVDLKTKARCRFIAVAWGVLLTLSTAIHFIQVQDPSLFPNYIYFDISIAILILGIAFTHFYRRKQIHEEPKLIFRTGSKEDSESIASLIISAGGGIVEFLLHDLSTEITVEQIMKRQVEDKQSEFYHKNCIVAIFQNKIVGLALAYPSDLFHKPESGFIPEERILHLKNFYASKIKNSLYLHALAVSEEARGKGIASKLLEKVNEKAVSQGLNSVSLDVWCDNSAAISLYKKFGYKTVNTIDIPYHRLLPHQNGMQVMILRSLKDIF